MSEHDPYDDLDDIPTGKSKAPAFLFLVLLVGAAAGGWAYLNIEPTAEDLVKEGTRALASGETDTATAAFESALKLEPKRLDGHRGLAETAGRRGDSAAKVKWLQAALALPGISKQDRGHLSKELASAATGWAAKTKDKDEAAYEQALMAAAKVDAKSPAHQELASHLIAVADEFELKGNIFKAAEKLKVVRTLNAKDRLKAKALKTEVGHRVRLFTPRFLKEFKEKHEQALIKTKIYDPKNRGFYIRVEVEKAPTTPYRAGSAQAHLHDVAIKNLANEKVKEATLAQVASIASTPAANLKKWPASVVSWEQRTWIENWARRPSKYVLGVVLPFDDVVRLVWLMRYANES